MGLRTRWTTAVAAVMAVGAIGAVPALAATPTAPVNTPPVGVPDTVSAVVGTEVRVNPVANDTDADSADVLSLSGIPVLASGSAKVLLAGPDVVITPTPGTISPLVLTYVVTDGKASATSTITVNVLPAPNRPPMALADVARMYAGAVARVDPRGNDSDPDGEPLTVTAAAVTGGSGSVTLEGSVLVIRSAAGFVGPLVISYVVSDPRGGQARSTVTVTVVPAPNRPPVAGADAVTVKAGRTYRIPVLANDSDPDGDQLTLVKVSKAKHGRATRSGSKVVYRAPKSWTGRVRLTYTIKDSHGQRAKGVLTIRVRKRLPAAPNPHPSAGSASRRAVESALSHLGLPTGSVNGKYDARTRRALCAWRTITGRPANRRLPSGAEAKAIVASRGLPKARGSMVKGVNVSVTCQAAFWVSASRNYRRVMAATTGKPGYRTRLGTHRIFRTYHVWRYSTIYPDARMYKPMQFSGGQALHGSSTDRLVKTYPASHGCIRMLHRDIDALQAGGVGNGTLVRVFGAW